MFYATYSKRENDGLQNSSKRSIEFILRFLRPFERETLARWSDGHFSLHTYTKDTTFNADGDHCVFINGYISNRTQLEREFNLPQGTNFRANELAIVRALFNSGGAQALGRMKGSYVAGIYDKKTKQLTVSNDRNGIRPMFIAQTPDKWIFSSRYQPATFEDGFDKALNLNAVETYFSVGMVLPPQTFFANINFLERGTRATLTAGGLKQEPVTYAYDESASNAHLSIQDAADLFHQKVSQVVKFMVERHDIRKMYLTGGSDSRIILGSLTPELRKYLAFLTYQAPSWSPDDQDFQVAKGIVEKWGLKHDVQSFVGFKGILPMGAVATSFRRTAFPGLTGSFGTELVGGGVFRVLPINYTFFRHDQYNNMRARLFSEQISSKPECPYTEIINGVENHSGACKEFGYLVNVFLRSFFTSVYSAHGTHAYISPWENQHADKHSPFTTEEVLDVLKSMPREYLVNYRLYNQLFRTTLKEFTEVPFNSAMTMFSQAMPSVPKVTAKTVYTQFPYMKALNANPKHEAFQLPVFKPNALMAEAEHNFDIAVRAVDFLFWYEMCVNGRAADLDWTGSAVAKFIGDKPFEPAINAQA